MLGSASYIADPHSTYGYQIVRYDIWIKCRLSCQIGVAICIHFSRVAVPSFLSNVVMGLPGHIIKEIKGTILGICSNKNVLYIEILIEC